MQFFFIIYIYLSECRLVVLRVVEEEERKRQHLSLHLQALMILFAIIIHFSEFENNTFSERNNAIHINRFAPSDFNQKTKEKQVSLGILI